MVYFFQYSNQKIKFNCIVTIYMYINIINNNYFNINRFYLILTNYLVIAKLFCNLHTWKCWLETHLANWCINGFNTFRNSNGSIMSKISSNSLRNITCIYHIWWIFTGHNIYFILIFNKINFTSFGECVFGQNFNKLLITGSVRDGSFSRNCTIQ